MLKKSRFFIGVALFVQAFTCFVMFIILCAKKKSISAAFLAVATMEFAVGTYLLYQEKQEWDEDMRFSDYIDDSLDDFDEDIFQSDLRHGKDDDEMYEEEEIEIPREDNVSEDEFKDR